MAGFQTMVRSGIELTVGRTAVVDVVLSVGEVTQAVTVTGEAALVETATATVSSLVSEKAVGDLPLNNRDLTQLAYLQPGVIKVARTGTGLFSGMGSYISVAGMRGTQNQFLLDGVSSADLSGNPQGTSGSYTGAETVKEFQIITNNYSAEYRSAAGAIVSAVTKSGTNTLHGSLFEFLRNDNLDATNWTDNKFGEKKAEFKRNQFGGSLGGPMIKDRTFFFGSYEGLREREGETSLARIPSMAARQGILPNKTVTVSAVVMPYLALYPVPGQGNTLVQDFGDGTVRIAGPGRTVINDDFVAARFDHNFASAKSGFLSGTYNFSTGYRRPFGVLSEVSGEGEDSKRHILSVAHTSVLSASTLNEFRFGFSLTEPRGRIPVTKRDWGNLKFVPHMEEVGSISISSPSVSTIGWGNAIGVFRQKNFTVTDGLAVTRGNHSYRTGVDLDFRRYHHCSGGDGASGEYSFATLENFLLSFPDQFIAQVQPVDVGPGGCIVPRYLRHFFFGSYFQDNWQVRPSLTLNLGLRYEFATVPTEADNRLSNLIDFVSGTEATVGKFYTNATKLSFSPRFGFAWAPGNRKTSVRGGFGVFYEHPNFYHFKTNLEATPPFIQIGNVTQLDAQRLGTTLVFPNAYTTQRSLLTSIPQIWSHQYEQDNTYIYRWSLTLQRELGADWLVSAGYTGSRALHLWVQGVDNINRWEGWPNQPAGPKFFPAVATTNYINQAWGNNVRIQQPKGNAFYHGLAAGAQKRLSHGLQLQLSYTFAKAIDEGSGIVGGDNLYGVQRGIYTYDFHLQRSLSSLDIRNNFTANFTYEFPSGADLSGIAAVLAKGWQFNGILSLSDGFPLIITDSTREQQNRIGNVTGLRPNLIAGGSNNPVLGGPQKYYDIGQFVPSICTGIPARGIQMGQAVCRAGDPEYRPGYFGNLGRNTLTAPGLATFDFSVFKRFALTEASGLQFRAEFFNLFNRPNFGSPDVTPWDSSARPDPLAAEISSTRTSARQIQFGVRYTF
jgi:hypothetical protein